MSDDDPLKVLRFGVAAIIISVALIVSAGNIWSLLYSDRLSFQRLGSVWIALTLLSLGLTRYIVSEIAKGASGRGPMAEMVRRKLDKVVFSDDKGWLNYMNTDGVEYEKPLITWEEVREEITRLEDYVSYRLQPTEIFIGISATIQWGYGDLIFCFLHGKGFSTC